MAPRGPKFSVVEDMEISRAFLSASEDGRVGADQKGGEFEKKMHTNFTILLEEANEHAGVVYPFRSPSSLYNRFKKLSKLLLKLIGTEKTCGDPPSGDSDRDQWTKKALETYVLRHKDAKNIIENLQSVKPILEGHPKWTSFEKEEEEGEPKENNKKRPAGTRKLKQLDADKKLLTSIMSGSVSEKKTESNKRLKNRDDFYSGVNGSVQLMAATYAASQHSSQDLQLLQMLSTPDKSIYAKKLLDAKLAERASMKISSSSTLPSTVQVALDDNEVELVGYKAPSPAYRAAHLLLLG